MNKKKIISYSIDVILVGIILLLGYVVISMMATRSKNYNVPQVFGKSFLYVATDSMNDPDNKNCLAPGTGIIIEKVKSYESLTISKPIYGDKENPTRVTDYDKSGDIVTFYLHYTMKSIPLGFYLCQYHITNLQRRNRLDKQPLITLVLKIRTHAIATQRQSDALAFVYKASHLRDYYAVR
jgi:hypothetical protein